MQFSVPLPAVLNAGGSKGLIVFGLQQGAIQAVFRNRHKQNSIPICKLQFSDAVKYLGCGSGEPIKIRSPAQRALVHDCA